ncbi:MAG: hypothetical protein J7M25_07320 [Deltaproteobacteria bacterium]|nr:hypothetical protein [Deltaproteobacteria bacterium]
MTRIGAIFVAIIFTSPWFGLQVGCGPDSGGPSNNGSDGGNQVGDGGSKSDAGSTEDSGSGCSNTCTEENSHRCAGTTIEVCALGTNGCLSWQADQDCADQEKMCDDSNGDPACVSPPSCDDGILNQDETDVDCGGSCPPCDVGLACTGDDDCASDACTNNVCVLCHPATFHCFGNWLRQCANDESSWQDVQHCDPHSNQVCDAVAHTCSPAQPIGNGPDNPTGVYYQYAEFCTSNSPFQGGFDVGSMDDLLFINRDGQHVDVYSVTLQDTDGDGLLEPNQHPDNPDNTGPIENRVLALTQTYNVPISNDPNWPWMSNEIYPTQTDIYFMAQMSGEVGLNQYNIASGNRTLIVPWDNTLGLNQTLGYDDVHQVWYTLNYGRQVFSWDPDAQEWALEFMYPNLVGGHADGLEVVTDPATEIPYVYVSDMTSDFLGQYLKNKDGSWTQVNLFQYNRGEGDYIEGMGFGALSHFWMSAVVDPQNIHATNCIYEIGGGDLSQYTGGGDPTHM